MYKDDDQMGKSRWKPIFAEVVRIWLEDVVPVDLQGFCVVYLGKASYRAFFSSGNMRDDLAWALDRPEC